MSSGETTFEELDDAGTGLWVLIEASGDEDTYEEHIYVSEQ